MSTFYLLNAVNFTESGITTRLRPGRLVDDAVTSTTALQNAGGQLWPSSDTVVAAAAVLALSAMAKGANDIELESIMRGGVDEAMRGSGGAADVGIADAGGFYTATTAEAALQELPTQLKARAVATSIGTYTAAAGVLTVTATGALAAQDGVTMVAGDVDVLLVPEGLTNVTAADAGPYTVTVLGTSTTSAKLTRPGWWSHGSALIPGRTISIGGEGTLFAGSDWKCFAAKSKLVGTDAPALYPNFTAQQITLSTGVATATNVPLLSTTKTKVTFDRRTAGGTVTTTVQYNVSAITAGVLGTATTTVMAQTSTAVVNASDTSVGILSIQNW